MTEIDGEIVDDELKESTEENMKDYASRRLTELRNYEQQLVGQLTKFQQSLANLNTELVATRGIIGEMLRIIGDEEPNPSSPTI